MSQSMKDEHLMITWDMVEEFVSKYLESSDRPAYIGVYGIPRGGLVLATILSYRLGIPMLTAPVKGCLVVDDVADSGKTLLHYEEKGYDLLTMVYKPQSIVEPDIHFITTSSWVVFPWEGGFDESE